MSTEAKSTRRIEVNAATAPERSLRAFGRGIGAPGAALAAWLQRQGLDPHRELVGRYDPAERRWFFWQSEEESDD